MIETESTKQKVRSHRLPIERAVTGLTMYLYGRRPLFSAPKGSLP